MLLALLFYGYATGTFSSRKIERATYDSIAFRYITANEHPDHDTICTFRRRFLDELQDLFVRILEVAHEMDLLEIGDISIDGTKVNANASKPKPPETGSRAKDQVNLTDEESRIMFTGENGYQQAYNVQGTVCKDSHLILDGT